jgi:transcription elongation factor Elf1
MALHEREFFHEHPESKPAAFTCPKCRHRDEYQVRWIRRTRKSRPPAMADERDRALFGKLRDYLVRVDDVLTCKRCGRRFEIPSQQSVVFI